MDEQSVRREMRSVIDEHGPWNAYNFAVADGVYTRGSDDTSATERRLAHFVQLVCDLAPRPIDQLRILDLACLEGIFALEFAKRGAEVIAIEGRLANVERARFAARALGLENAHFFQDDVRNLSSAKHGHFDVVLCLGILYHLDAPDVFEFVERIADVCTGFTVIDTHVSLRPKERRSYREIDYRGRSYLEHAAESTAAQRVRATRSSLDNPTSFWLTKRSLFRLLSLAGFTTMLESAMPIGVARYSDRSVLVAFNGSPTLPELVQRADAQPSVAQSWPERDPRRPHRSQAWRERVRTEVARMTPRRARAFLRRFR